MPQKIRMPSSMLAEIVGVGDLDGEEVAQQHRDEDVGGDQADEDRRDPLDRVDEAVHEAALHVTLPPGARDVAAPSMIARPIRARAGLSSRRPVRRLCFASVALRVLQIASGSPPAFLTASAHALPAARPPSSTPSAARA